MPDFDYLIEKAEIFEEEGKYLHAIQIYFQLRSEEETFRYATIKLSEIYESMDKLISGYSILSEYIEQHPDDSEMIVILAEMLIRNSEYDAAIEVLDNDIEDETDEIVFLSGVAQFYKGDLEFAGIKFSEFLEVFHESDLCADAYLYKAKIAIKYEEYDNALENAKKSEILFPENYETQLLLARLFFAKEMYFHAYENIKKCLKIVPEYPQALLFAGKILVRMKEFDKAEKYLNDFFELSDPNEESYFLLGTIYSETGRKEEADFYFNKALEVIPSVDNIMDGTDSLV